MKYTKEQLTKLWNYLEEDEAKQNQIENGLKAMFEDQYPPFLNFYCIPSVIDILDPKLWEVLSYVWYECRSMKKWWKVEIDWKWSNIPWNLKWFLRYCKLEDLLTK